MTLQVIYMRAGHYEVAGDDNSEVPQWPVQESGGRWIREAFPGQRAAYTPRTVDFGVAVRRCTDAEENELEAIASDEDRDLPAGVYRVDQGSRTDRGWYMEV